MGNEVSSALRRDESRAARVLVVDDEAEARETLAEFLTDEGYETRTAASGGVALSYLGTYEPDAVLTDLFMPHVDGLELLERSRHQAPHAAIVLMTGRGSIGTAVAAMKKGAEHYLTKPLDLQEVSEVIERAVEKARRSRGAAQLRRTVETRGRFGGILGDHPAMQRLLAQVAQVADSAATVLIHGESGTGKELIASAIHHNSSRKTGPFVRLNCAALSESLLESELFGHERGAFTGAHNRREGRFAQADGGTLFLDEVSEIPPPLQVKLLRFLQEREFERVGSNRTIRVDVRIVAATNADLNAMVQAGSFRQDLFYRLNVVPLQVPPLRARKSDIPLLAHAFLRKHAQQNNREAAGFTDEAIRWLLDYYWPGNVRELENVVERAVVMSRGACITVEDFPLVVEPLRQDELDVLVPGISMNEVERIVILKTLAACGGSTGKTSKVLGISRRKIQYRLKEWGIVAQDLVPNALTPQGDVGLTP